MSFKNGQTDTLRRALTSANRHEQARAAIQLGYGGDRESINQLRDLATNADDLVAIAAMFGCWQLGIDAVSIKRMVAALSSSDEELVQESVFALCEMGEAIVPKLTALLEEYSPYADNILRVLADIGGDRAFNAIKHFQTDDTNLLRIIDDLLDDWDEAD